MTCVSSLPPPILLPDSFLFFAGVRRIGRYHLSLSRHGLSCIACSCCARLLGAGEDKEPVGVTGTGDPGLVAVDHPLISALLGKGLCHTE